MFLVSELIPCSGKRFLLSSFSTAMALPSWTLSLSFTQDLGEEVPPGVAAPSGMWDLRSHGRRGKVKPKNQERAFHCLSLQVTRISPAHNSLARTNHLVLPNWTGCSTYKQAQVKCMSKTKSTTQSEVGRTCSLVLTTICDYDTGFKGSHYPGRALNMLWFYLTKGVELSVVEKETSFIWSIFLGWRTSTGIRLLASSSTPDWLRPTAKSGDDR